MTDRDQKSTLPRLRSITFRKAHRCFVSGESIGFTHGVNLLVGDNGCGKSTIIAALRNPLKDKAIAVDCPLKTKLVAFDFERDNLRVQRSFSDNLSMGTQALAFFKSHGQCSLDVVGTLANYHDSIMLLDEPDQALSIAGCRTLTKAMSAAAHNGCQVIAAVHNPLVIAAFTDVFDVASRQWVPSSDYLLRHGVTISTNSVESAK
jgi:predicted ATPase